MWIEVRSPHSNKPVRIRDKDVGRSVRDDEGRVFFVLPRTDGEGYYGSLTRQGGPDHEQKYLEMIAKEEHARAVGQERSAQQIHDATGRRRSHLRGKLVILALLIMVLVLVWLFTIGPLGKLEWKAPPKEQDKTDQKPPDQTPKQSRSRGDVHLGAAVNAAVRLARNGSLYCPVTTVAAHPACPRRLRRETC